MHHGGGVAAPAPAQAHGTSSTARSYFYPRERFTVERPHTMQLVRCTASYHAFLHRLAESVIGPDVLWQVGANSAYIPILKGRRPQSVSSLEQRMYPKTPDCRLSGRKDRYGTAERAHNLQIQAQTHPRAASGTGSGLVAVVTRSTTPPWNSAAPGGSAGRAGAPPTTSKRQNCRI